MKGPTLREDVDKMEDGMVSPVNITNCGHCMCLL